MLVSSVIKISTTNDHSIPPFHRRKFIFPLYKVKYLNMNVFTFSPPRVSSRMFEKHQF